MELLPNTSLIYLTAIDYKDDPKIIMGSILGSTFAIFHTVYGYDILTSAISTFVVIELFLRMLFLMWIAGL
jgi:hypothetical protein